MKKEKKNYYAIHYIGTKENVITSVWSECKKLTQGRHNMYKGFSTLEEAERWIKGITPLQEKRHSERVQKAQAMKELKKSSVKYMFSIDKKLSDDLQAQLTVLHISIDRLMDDLIRDGPMSRFSTS